QQSHREPDGTGLGFFDSRGHPHIDKQPCAAFADRAFAREAREVRATTFLAHIRYASTGAVELKNTHPFEQRNRLFAHNGVVEDLQALERRIGAGMSLVRGDTDSERMFALITSETERHGDDIEAGIASAVRWVAENLPLLSLNFILITGDELWALRYPETHALYVLERSGGQPLAQNSSHGTRVHSSEAALQRTVVLASEVMDDDPGWRELRTGELVHVTSDLTLRSRTLLEHAPAHPLSLADLEGRERESQAG